jgi:porphobilinogen synthase
VISEVRREFDLPVAAYNVSGEYAMLRGRRREGLDRLRPRRAGDFDLDRRAGADIILTYHTKDASRLLGRKKALSFFVDF